MKAHQAACVAVLLLTACNKDTASSSTVSSASTTAAITSAAPSVAMTAAVTATATTVAAVPVPGGFEPTKDEWFGLQQKMMGAYDHFDTCAKLATNLDKWNVDNKDYMTKFRAWVKANPDRAKVFKQDSLDAHKADMVDWPKKIAPAQKCQFDPKVGAALKAINEG